jgi:hypothetical protein
MDNGLIPDQQTRIDTFLDFLARMIAERHANLPSRSMSLEWQLIGCPLKSSPGPNFRCRSCRVPTIGSHFGEHLVEDTLT